MSVFQLGEIIFSKTIFQNNHIPLKRKDTNLKPEIIDIETCRVCAASANIPISINIHDNVTVMSAIRTVCNISISQLDPYPKYICQVCLEELKSAFRFKMKCEATASMFRRAIPSETIVPQTTPFVKNDFSLLLAQIQQRRRDHSNSTIKPDDYKVYGNVRSPIDDRTQHYVSSDGNECSFKTKEFNKTESDSERSHIDDEIRLHYDSSDSEYQSPTSYKKEKEPFSKPLNRKRKKVLKEIEKEMPVKERGLETNGISWEKDMEGQRNKKTSWKCSRCNEIFKTKVTFSRHVKEKSCQHRSCPTCGKVVLNLPLHEQVMHLRDKKFTCHLCGRMFYSNSALSNHIRVHKLNKEFHCDLCPYKGRRKQYLVAHMAIHSGEHRFLCAMCPAKFNNHSNLRKHVLVHKEKGFQCDVCQKKFRAKQQLKAHHDSIHLKIKVQCSLCGKYLSTRKKLLNHELRIHKRERHKLFDVVQRVIVNDGVTTPITSSLSGHN